MAPKQYHAPRRDEFPDALSGGEGRESPGSRLGERERRNPKVENVDPAGAQPDDVIGEDRPQALAQPEGEETVEEKLGLHPLGASAGAVGGTLAGAAMGAAAGPVGSGRRSGRRDIGQWPGCVGIGGAIAGGRGFGPRYVLA